MVSFQFNKPLVCFFYMIKSYSKVYGRTPIIRTLLRGGTMPYHNVNDRVSIVQHSSASKEDEILGSDKESNKLKTKNE